MIELLAKGTKVALDNILFATDFSAASNAALPYVLKMAREYGSKTYVAHVVSFGTFANLPPGACQALAEQEERRARQEMARFGSRFEGVRYEGLLRTGDIWRSLADIIEEKDIDLVVVGTHGRSGVRKLLMGSVAEEIFRQATCPVITVGPNVVADPAEVAEMREILYATDFTPESLAAAPYAISLAQEHQAHLSLVHVVKEAEAGTKDPNQTVVGLTERLLELVPPEAELWCEPRPFVEYGPPVERILELADRQHADLIVLGVRSGKHPGASTHLPMATADKIVAEAKCPVFTVRG